MEASRASRSKAARRLKLGVPHFDVVVKQTIGTLYADETGELNPFEAAFKMIASGGDEGQFEFTVPKEIMGHDKDVTCNLTVEYSTKPDPDPTGDDDR
jgi:hypothetical protein